MIKQLPQAAIQQITTSVALQNLSSFIKELIENSIDANSKNISITFYESGKDGFEISDDGCGISLQQSKNVAVKGGTSKMEIWDDLEKVETLGFRGEALNAISQLSNLTISSKVQDEEMGWQYQFNQDERAVPQLIAKEKGTKLQVNNLYQNLPVRKIEFEKNYKSQYNRTINLITEYAIIQPGTEFKVWNQENNKVKNQVFNSGQSQSFENRLITILNQKQFDQLLQLSLQVDESIQVEGYIQNKIDSGSVNLNRKSLWYCYINKRPINPPKNLLSLMSSIYRQFNPNGRFIFILEFNIKQIQDIDFNVSVDKRDVYFKNMDLCFRKLDQYIRDILDVPNEKVVKVEKKLQKNSSISQMEIEKNNLIQTQQKIQTPKENQNESTATTKNSSGFLQKLRNSIDTKQQYELVRKEQQIQQQDIIKSDDNIQISIPSKIILDKQQNIRSDDLQNQQEIQLDKELDDQDIKFTDFGYSIQNDTLSIPNQNIVFNKQSFNDFQILGQYNKGFIVCFSEQTGQIYILDQHACDEKITYENIIKKSVIQQIKLLNPLKIDLQGYEIEICRNYAQQLQNIGFNFQIDDNELYLTSTPQIGKFQIHPSAFQSVLSNLDQKFQFSFLDLIPGIKQKIASQACRSSIMIGEVLSKIKMKEICCNMSNLTAPWNCPHGRPTFIRIESNLDQFIEQTQIKRGFSKNL